MKGVILRAWFAFLFAALPEILAAATGSLPGNPTNADPMVAEGKFEYNSRLWQTDEGLPNNFVRAIVQTEDGYLWLGTSRGLARFDGIRFVLVDPPNTPALHNANVTALYVDPEGALWIGTYGGGLACLKDGDFLHFSTTNGLAGAEITALCSSRGGGLWIGTTAGLSHYDGKAFKNYSRKDGLLSGFIRALCEDEAGNLWIATGNGLNRIAGGAVSSFTTTNGLKDNSVRGLWQDGKGRIWIGSNVGLTTYEQGTFKIFKAGEGLADGFVQAFCQDREGNLWVGAFGGVYRFVKGELLPKPDAAGVSYDQINVLFRDREDSIWAGSREGLIRFTPRRFVTYTRREGLGHNNIMSVLEDSAGKLWVATWGGGLAQFKDGQVNSLNTRNGLPTDLVLSLCEARDGTIWAGAEYDAGLVHIDGQKLTRYTSKDGLLNAPIHVVLEDRSGRLWAGTSKGLSCWSGGKFIHPPPQRQLAGRKIRAICEDRKGRLWFGTEDGLSCWQDGQFTNYTVASGLSANLVLSLYADADDDLWIGTWGGGLNRLHNDKFTSCTTAQGLFSDNVLALVEDDAGCFWMSCPEGISRIGKSELLEAAEQGGVVHPVSYGRLDGLMSVQFNGVGQPSGYKSRDGHLWFPTTKGLVSVETAIPVNLIPPPVMVEEVIIGSRLVKPGAAVLGGAGANREASRWTAPSLRARRQHGELEFHFTALSFQLPEKNRFKYKLEGMDSDWIDAGARRIAHYNSLDPGSYRFLVMACNSDGVWNQAAASVSLALLPYFWETTWFRVLVALVLAGSIAGGVRLISLRKLRQKLALVQRERAIESERARIAKDIHDDLGSSLSRIAMLAELVEADKASPEAIELHGRQIANSARSTVRSLDEIVWAVSPEHDTWNSLAEYLSRYASEFFEGTSVRCRLEIPLDLPQSSLSSEVRHHFFLVVKEGLNNALKHSGAAQVLLRLVMRDSKVEFEISDDGRGFEPGRVNGSRHGLVNMRARMEAIGGMLELSSHPGRGTTLRLVLPLPPSHFHAMPNSPPVP